MSRRYLTPSALLLGAAGVGLALMATYVVLRIITTWSSEYTIVGGILAVAMIAAELYAGMLAVGNVTSLFKATTGQHRNPLGSWTPHTTAPVAVLVTSFNESEEVLEETLSAVCAMDYPAFNVYLVDDSTREACQQAAARLAERYGARLVHRKNRAGYKAGAINDLLPQLTERYMAFLDADQRPMHSWLNEIVPLLERNPRLAFVQTPQIYVNTEGLPVAVGAAYQQAVFYEYICEGKSASNAMFFCGTNVVLRCDALRSIERLVAGRRHFLDETSVTEDFATSVRLHVAGWQSTYINRQYCVGMSPETLAAYFTQQMRWAMGTFGVYRTLLARLFTSPRSLTLAQWWEYSLSGVYYFIGLVNLTFLLAPVAFLLFDIKFANMDPHLYVALFVPYLTVTMGFFFIAMKMRGYPVSGIWLGLALTMGTFWIYVKATGIAVLGLKRAFGVTPKAVGGSIPIKGLVPQIIMFLLSCCAALAGILHIVTVEADVAHVVTTWWAIYNVALLSTLLFYFNRPVTIRPRQPVLQRVEVAAL